MNQNIKKNNLRNGSERIEYVNVNDTDTFAITVMAKDNCIFWVLPLVGLYNLVDSIRQQKSFPIYVISTLIVNKHTH